MAVSKQASATDWLSEDQLRQLQKLSPWRTGYALILAWGSIALAVAAVAWMPHPLMVLAAMVVIGSRQFALAVLMHEAAHGLLSRNRRLNDAIGQWLCAWPVMLDLVPYRPYHATHHRYTETDKDPDLALSRTWPVSRASMVRKIVRDLTGIAGVRRYFGYLRSAFGQSQWPLHRRLAHLVYKLRGFLLTNLVLLGLFSWTVGWYWYLLLWWVPMLTWYSLVYRLRNIAEHALVPGENEFNVARTTLASGLYRWLLAPFNVNYHGEHHLLPSCPWYRLPRMHAMLREKNLTGRMCLADGYSSVLARVVARPA